MSTKQQSFVPLSVDWNREEVVWLDTAHDKTVFGSWLWHWIRAGVASCAFPSLTLSHSLTLFAAAIVAEIYSEISLLTPTAPLLNERPVKLMGQIQSFLVTQFTTHTHIPSDTHTDTRYTSPFLLRFTLIRFSSLTGQRSVSLCSRLHGESNLGTYNRRLYEQAAVLWLHWCTVCNITRPPRRIETVY